MQPGSVTPFAVINDKNHDVTMVLDKGVMDGGPVNCHPLVNTMTTAVSPEDLVRFLEAEGHPPEQIELE